MPAVTATVAASAPAASAGAGKRNRKRRRELARDSSRTSASRWRDRWGSGTSSCGGGSSVRAIAAVCLRRALAVFRAVFVAMPSNQGSSGPPSASSRPRHRQASRNVSETASSAADQSPSSR
nr:hypothetical protein [Cryptosporangium aurantiacum]